MGLDRRSAAQFRTPLCPAECNQFSGSSSRDKRGPKKSARARGDGKTNTVFFDGHAVSVQSKRLIANNAEMLYGFPGTVNPYKHAPNANHPIWQAYWE